MHGGLSTGPRTVEGRARISAAAQARWERDARAAGLGRPPATLSAYVADFLEGVTWKQAIGITGLSRRTLERLAGGRFCSPDEIAAIRSTLELAALEAE